MCVRLRACVRACVHVLINHGTQGPHDPSLDALPSITLDPTYWGSTAQSYTPTKATWDQAAGTEASPATGATHSKPGAHAEYRANRQDGAPPASLGRQTPSASGAPDQQRWRDAHGVGHRVGPPQQASLGDQRLPVRLPVLRSAEPRAWFAPSKPDAGTGVPALSREAPADAVDVAAALTWLRPPSPSLIPRRSVMWASETTTWPASPSVSPVRTAAAWARGSEGAEAAQPAAFLQRDDDGGAGVPFRDKLDTTELAWIEVPSF